MSVCPACHHHLPPLPHVTATSPTSPSVTMEHSSTTSFEWCPKELVSLPPLVSTSHHVTPPSWHITPSCHVTATCPTSRTCHVSPACRTRPPYVCGCALSHEGPPPQGHLLSPVSNCGGSLTVASDPFSWGSSSLSPLRTVGDFGASVEHRVQFNHSGGGVVTSNTGTSGGGITGIADDLLNLKLSNLNSCPTSPSIPTVCVKRGSWPNHTTQFPDPNSLTASCDTRPRKCSLGNFHASACGQNCVSQHLCLFNSSNNIMDSPRVCPQQLQQQQQTLHQLQQQLQQQLQPPNQEPNYDGVCSLRSHSLSRQSSCPNSSPCLMAWPCTCLQQHHQHHRFSSSECLEQIPCQFTNFSSAHQHKQQQGSNPFLHQQHLHSFHLKPSDDLESQNNNLHCSQSDISAPTTATESDNFVIFNSMGGGGLITERRTPSRSNSPDIKFTISLPPGGDSSLPSSGAASPSRRSGEESSVSLDRAALMRTLASLPFVSTSSSSSVLSSPLYGDAPNSSSGVRESPRDAPLLAGSGKSSNDPSFAGSDSFIRTPVSQTAAPSSQSVFVSQGTNENFESSIRSSQASPINFHQHQPSSLPSLPPHATSNATFQNPSEKLLTHNNFITFVNNFFMSNDHHPSAPTTVSVSSNVSKQAAASASCVASVRNLNSAKRDWSSADDSRVLRSARAELEECGWYYGGLTWQEAGAVLAGTPEGTFLIRDSWSGRCLYALSVQTSIGPTSVRIEYEDGLFRPESETGSRDGAPQKPSVVALVQSYMRSSNSSHVWVNHFGQTVSAITVRKPLRQKPASLRHLARLAFNSAPQDQALSSYRIPNVIIAYLKAYPHWC